MKKKKVNGGVKVRRWSEPDECPPQLFPPRCWMERRALGPAHQHDLP